MIAIRGRGGTQRDFTIIVLRQGIVIGQIESHTSAIFVFFKKFDGRDGGIPDCRCFFVHCFKALCSDQVWLVLITRRMVSRQPQAGDWLPMAMEASSCRSCQNTLPIGACE